MNIMAELAIIFGICLVSEGISALLPIALPASVISMLVLLAQMCIRDRLPAGLLFSP